MQQNPHRSQEHEFQIEETLMSKNIRIPFSDIARGLDRNIEQADSIRIVGLEGLHSIRIAKRSGLQREQQRLNKKLGEDDPRVKALEEKLANNQNLIRELAVGVNRAKIATPEVDEDSWIIHGRIYNKELLGISGLAVGLYDKNGRKLEQVADGRTNESGYYKLGHTVSTDITDAGTPLDPAEERPMQAFIHVVDREGETLHVSRRSLKLEAGHVYYHEIHLRDN